MLTHWGFLRQFIDPIQVVEVKTIAKQLSKNKKNQDRQEQGKQKYDIVQINHIYDDAVLDCKKKFKFMLCNRCYLHSPSN